jgi:hypothetical protein
MNNHFLSTLQHCTYELDRQPIKYLVEKTATWHSWQRCLLSVAFCEQHFIVWYNRSSLQNGSQRSTCLGKKYSGGETFMYVAKIYFPPGVDFMKQFRPKLRIKIKGSQISLYEHRYWFSLYVYATKPKFLIQNYKMHCVLFWIKICPKFKGKNLCEIQGKKWYNGNSPADNSSADNLPNVIKYDLLHLTNLT